MYLEICMYTPVMVSYDQTMYAHVKLPLIWYLDKFKKAGRNKLSFIKTARTRPHKPTVTFFFHA